MEKNNFVRQKGMILACIELIAYALLGLLHHNSLQILSIRIFCISICILWIYDIIKNKAGFKENIKNIISLGIMFIGFIITFFI